MVTVRVSRSGTTRLTPNQWLVWRPEPERAAEPLPAEWVFRALRSVDLDDPAWLLAVLDRRGMCWGDLARIRDEDTVPAETGWPALPARDDPGAQIHLAVIREQLLTLRELTAGWLDHAATGGPLPGRWWRLLDRGLRGFTPVALAAPTLDVDLYEAGCWQLFAATQDLAPLRACGNEPCSQLFYRKDGAGRRTADVAYCSEACRAAAKQRRHRARNRTRLTTY